jgi:hypothetical protein
VTRRLHQFEAVMDARPSELRRVQAAVAWLAARDLDVTAEAVVSLAGVVADFAESIPVEHRAKPWHAGAMATLSDADVTELNSIGE